MMHLSVASVLVMKRGDATYMGSRRPIYQLRWRNDPAAAARMPRRHALGTDGRSLEPILLG
jgi:hypothetical protein